MNKQRIVVITDCVDVAANEIRATLVSNIERLGAIDRVEIEPIVNASEFSVINGAFLTRLMADNYNPESTVFLIILNPLSTSRHGRARLVGKTKNGIRFVGENTGTLSWLLHDFGIDEIYESSKEGLNGKGFISFGGKYIHAPIAAKVAAGIKLNELGVELDREILTKFEITSGTVVHIDNFGVPKIYATLSDATNGQKYQIFVNGEKRFVAEYADSMKTLNDGDYAIYKGSSVNSLAEIGIVRELETAKKLGIKIGDIVTWEMI